MRWRPQVRGFVFELGILDLECGVLEVQAGQLVIGARARYTAVDLGRAENRFPRSSPGEEESPNTKGRDAA